MQTINDMLFNTSTPEQTDERSSAEISRDNIEMKTDLSKQAIKAISKGLMHAQIFSDTTIADLCQTVMVLSVSSDFEPNRNVLERLIG